MRFDEFTLRVPGDEFRTRFHDELTVLAGVGAEERKALLDSLVGALTGESDDTVLTCRDHTGRHMELTSIGGRLRVRFVDDGTPGPSPIGWFAPDAQTLRELMVLSADDLGLAPSMHDRPDDTPEIAEARATLRELAAQLEGADEARQRATVTRDTIEDLDRRIRAAEGGAARREYAKALARLEAVKAEARVLDGGEAAAVVDRRMLDAMPDIEDLALRWREAAAAASVARRDGDVDIDPVELVRWIDVPAAPPAELGSLLADVEGHDAAVARLERRLRDIATATMPEPEDNRVLPLATIDQRLLWEVHRRLVWADEAVEREQLALGGVGSDRDQSASIEELEQAHRRVEDIDGEIERRRPPVLAGAVVLLVAALVLSGTIGIFAVAFAVAAGALAWTTLVPLHRARAEAATVEAEVLARLNVPTYLAFHLRRVDATLDPTSQNRLEVARAEAALARRSWESVAGDTDPAVATALEPEIRAYASALREQGGAVEALAQLHRELDDVAVPALRAAQDRAGEIVAPYGLGWEDIAGLSPHAVFELVAARIALGAAARGQRAAVDAVAEEEKLAGRLEELLARIAVPDGPLDDRLAAVTWASRQATERERARAAARPREEIEADVARLDAEVRRLERPEFGVVHVSEADEPDIEALLAERERLQARLAVDVPLVLELDRVADRHAAMERRITALIQASGADGDAFADLNELHQRLMAHLTTAAHVGPRNEPVPVLLDEPFVRVPAERKWELMDLLQRLAGKTQLLYVTDDPFVGAWARRRADMGTILLLEPVE